MKFIFGVENGKRKFLYVFFFIFKFALSSSPSSIFRFQPPPGIPIFPVNIQKRLNKTRIQKRKNKPHCQNNPYTPQKKINRKHEKKSSKKRRRRNHSLCQTKMAPQLIQETQKSYFPAKGPLLGELHGQILVNMS